MENLCLFTSRSPASTHTSCGHDSTVHSDTDQPASSSIYIDTFHHAEPEEVEASHIRMMMTTTTLLAGQVAVKTAEQRLDSLVGHTLRFDNHYLVLLTLEVPVPRALGADSHHTPAGFAQEVVIDIQYILHKIVLVVGAVVVVSRILMLSIDTRYTALPMIVAVEGEEEATIRLKMKQEEQEQWKTGSKNRPN